MTVTIAGLVAKPNDPVPEHSISGRQIGGHILGDIDVRLPNAGIRIDIDHDGSPIGRAVHLELDPSAALHAVAVIDGDELLELAERRAVYFSGTFRSITDDAGPYWTGERSRLLGLSLTWNPARSGQHPLTLVPGDIRDAADRARMPIGSIATPLLRRAVAATYEQRRGGSITILDLRTRDPFDGSPITDSDRDRRPSRTLEHRPAGRIVDVR